MATTQEETTKTRRKKPSAKADEATITSKTTHVITDVTKDDLTGIEAETIDVAAYAEMDAQAKAAYLRSLYDELLDKQARGITLGRQCVVLYHRLGVVLIAEKEKVEHGQWLDWLDDHAIHEKHAQRAMQIARHYKDENELRGCTLDDALKIIRKSSGKTQEPANKRRQIIKSLETMKDKVQKFTQDLGAMSSEREPLLRYIDGLENELRILRACCVGEALPQ